VQTQAINTNIRKTLLDIGAINDENIELFSEKTRDKNNISVLRDRKSGVIFIDNYYTGNTEYENGEYRERESELTETGRASYEDSIDSERRYLSYRQFIVAKNICDFGCGAGNFLRIASKNAAAVCGIELQQDFANSLNAAGIPCHSSLNALDQGKDTFFLFHCLEHLPDPLATLKEIGEKLKSNGNGRIIVEVPHARDFLITQLENQDFINFTLWSQHLVLHTRESLNRLLHAAGFRNVIIEGVQRYNLSNHFHWLKENKPGGHKSRISILETQQLTDAYAHALARIDANDTLVAIATT
jgi:2-polyprenyl-3-methyl-5-hydroxy-6-metoxy-1,4-benzoquinol methylase